MIANHLILRTNFASMNISEYLVMNIKQLTLFFSAIANVLDLIGGSRSTTPTSRKSPTADMGVQVNQKDNRRNIPNRGSQPHQQQQPQHERRDSGRIENQGTPDNRVNI